MEELNKITRALAKVEEGKLKAFSDQDRILIMIQDAPEELRRLANALEQLNIREIQALVAYRNPVPLLEGEKADPPDGGGETID